jgi:Rieske Fe-S protein
MDRSRFIRLCSSACLASAVAPLLHSCSSALHYANFQQEGNRLRVDSTEFLTADRAGFRPFVLVQASGLEFPVCLYRHADDDYSALYMKCTHQGCRVDAFASALVCPCHGSEFDTRGRVSQSPAETDLQTFEVEAIENYIYIRL